MGNTHQIVCKILNKVGAEVHVLKKPEWNAHGWLCTGCGEGEDPASANSLVETARGTAEWHAGKCRFLSA